MLLVNAFLTNSLLSEIDGTSKFVLISLRSILSSFMCEVNDEILRCGLEKSCSLIFMFFYLLASK